MSRPHKYHAKATVVDGIRFASLKESRRYQELKLLEKAGEIIALECQTPFTITIGEVEIARYRADFTYKELVRKHPGGVHDYTFVVEDVKGVRTPVYRLKKRLIEAQYGITIHEL